MAKKFSIKITVDPEERKVLIEDDAGNKRFVSGVALFGGKPEEGAFYLFGWGNSDSAAWAYGRGYSHAHEFDDPYYKNFFKRCAQNIAKILAPYILREDRTIEPEELIRRIDEIKEGDKGSKGTLH